MSEETSLMGAIWYWFMREVWFPVRYFNSRRRARRAFMGEWQEIRHMPRLGTPVAQFVVAKCAAGGIGLAIYDHKLLINGADGKFYDMHGQLEPHQPTHWHFAFKGAEAKWAMQAFKGHGWDAMPKNAVPLAVLGQPVLAS